MKRIIILSLIILLSVQYRGAAQCNIKNTAFQSGEKFQFTGYYQLGFIWLNFGKVNISVFDTTYHNRPAYKIMGDARNAKVYDMFFRLRDTLTTCVDKKTLTPLYLDRKTHEGNYHRRHVYKYDLENRKIHSFVTKKQTKHTVLDFNGCVNNLMSIMHYVRNIDYSKYKPGTNIPIQLIVDAKISKVYVRYHGIKKLRSKHCPKVDCYRITPVMPEGGMFKSGDKMFIWLTKDKYKIPLMVEAKIPVGSVKGILENYEGLLSNDNKLGKTAGKVSK